MNSRSIIIALSALCLFGSLVSGCSQPETKLSKDEEKNFKGSAEMSDEAKKRMAEGMARMAEIQKTNGRAAQPPAASGGKG